jgi:hypothetical protein
LLNWTRLGLDGACVLLAVLEDILVGDGDIWQSPSAEIKMSDTMYRDSLLVMSGRCLWILRSCL